MSNRLDVGGMMDRVLAPRKTSPSVQLQEAIESVDIVNSALRDLLRDVFDSPQPASDTPDAVPNMSLSAILEEGPRMLKEKVDVALGQIDRLREVLL